MLLSGGQNKSPTEPGLTFPGDGIVCWCWYHICSEVRSCRAGSQPGSDKPLGGGRMGDEDGSGRAKIYRKLESNAADRVKQH